MNREEKEAKIAYLVNKAKKRKARLIETSTNRLTDRYKEQVRNMRPITSIKEVKKLPGLWDYWWLKLGIIIGAISFGIAFPFCFGG